MYLNSDYYDTDFEMTYKGNKILIRNDGPEGESLYINGVLQDQNFEAHNGQLTGRIYDENNTRIVIEVVLGGAQTGDCLVYADGELIHSNPYDKEYFSRYEKYIGKKEKEKKKSNLFFPFLMIVIIAVCMVLLIPYLNGSGGI